MLDGGFEVDLDAVSRNIDEAEVVALFFPLLRKTLILDARPGETACPLLVVVDMVANPQQRFRAFHRLRPSLPRPHSITTIPWNRRIASLRSTGVWDHVLNRLSGHDEHCFTNAGACLSALAGLERREVMHALTGEDHHTLWGRPGVGDAANAAS